MKKINIEIPFYSPDEGFRIDWEEGFYIEVKKENGIVAIKGNKQGLSSLAKILFSMSQNEVPVHTHVHLDEDNSLEIGSSELIIEKSN